MPVTLSCDRCGAVVVERLKLLNVLGAKRGLLSLTDRLILCETCTRHFEAWLQAERPDSDVRSEDAGVGDDGAF
jgi:hypothetical protein